MPWQVQVRVSANKDGTGPDEYYELKDPVGHARDRRRASGRSEMKLTITLLKPRSAGHGKVTVDIETIEGRDGVYLVVREDLALSRESAASLGRALLWACGEGYELDQWPE